MSFHLRIGSRPSALALVQANLIRARIEASLPGIAIEIVAVSTSGDKLTTASLARIGGKGLFIRELEAALSDHRIDLAVHSMKDLPAVLPSEYRLAAVPHREDPRDALITRASGGWATMPHGARLGTSSTRRHLQALRQRPDLQIAPLRGNVDTRLARLAAGDFDAIILAMAGLKRLDKLSGLNFVELDERDFVPSGGQGALAIEVRADGSIGDADEIESAVAALNDLSALAEVTAERAFLATIGASCVSPVGVKGRVENATLTLRALLLNTDGSKSLADEISGPASVNASLAESTGAASALGRELGNRMIDLGARDLIESA
ncbi:MAG: hydroxymethylbilane synthase [Deltaproteobacteria bacterium]|nr:hydroxymethylbilane synthase [Deltaproteobacteria bacterium]